MSSPAQPGRVGLVSLGCPKNHVDSEIMLGELGSRGYQLVGDIDEAETVIVNTCGFIDRAKEESIDAILEVARLKESESSVQKLYVAGCMVNKYGVELRDEIPEIDGFIGLDQLSEVGDLVQLGGGPPLPAPAHLVFDHQVERTVITKGYGYLKVAEGCNNPCTFCAIPSWRGRFRSRTIESLVAEAQRLEAGGLTELCLIAQDTTRYGEDLGYGRHGLLRLVEALLEGTTFPWIRFLYAYPTTLDRELLRLMGAEERFVSYVDMPLQHSHREILRRMKRGGDGRRYLDLLHSARELVPDIFLRSTFIVGFPGERQEHFEDLIAFVKEAELDHLGAFVFSPEPDTPAAELDRVVPREIARRRYEQLLEAQRPISLARRQRLVGRIVETIIEGSCDETEHLMQGRHRGMAPEIDGRLLINDGMAYPGSIVDVEITEAYADDLVGRIVGPAGMPGVTPAPDFEEA